MIPPGLASTPLLTNASYGVGIATALAVVATFYLARLLLPRRDAAPPAPPVTDAMPCRPPVPPPSPAAPDSCPNHWDTPAAPADARREHDRRDGRPFRLQLLGPGDRQPQTARVLDRSRGGLRLSVGAPLPAGALVRVRRAGAAGDDAWVSARVRWCSTAGGGHEVGCQFTDDSPLRVMLLFR
jgi:hypothetical protein